MLSRRLLCAVLWGVTGCSGSETNDEPPDAAIATPDAATENDAGSNAEDATVTEADATAGGEDATVHEDATTLHEDAAIPDAIEYAYWEPAPELPEPLANNAITSFYDDTGCTAYSAMGIGPTRTQSEISSRVYSLRLGDTGWTHLTDVPGRPRVGASAVFANGKLHVIGGFSVDTFGVEHPYEEIDVFDLATGQWGPSLARNLLAIEAASAAYRELVVVVGGFASFGQIEAFGPTGISARAYLPEAIGERSGHAIAIVGDFLYLAGGMNSRFELEQDVWRARIREFGDDLLFFDQWTELAPYPGPARFRAAIGVRGTEIFLHGGSSAPYNYDGFSFEDGSPVLPINTTLVYDTATATASATWRELAGTPPTMDHRAMITCSDRLLVAGGMTEGPRVSADVWQLSFPLMP